MEPPKKIMRIRTKVKITEYDGRLEPLWASVQENTSTFSFERFLRSDYVVLTSSDGRILGVLEPTGIGKEDNEFSMECRSLVLMSDMWLGALDPVPSKSMNSIQYNWNYR